jgi:hypothetical protein
MQYICTKLTISSEKDEPKTEKAIKTKHKIFKAIFIHRIKTVSAEI